jgi:hypothetical protein
MKTLVGLSVAQAKGVPKVLFQSPHCGLRTLYREECLGKKDFFVMMFSETGTIITVVPGC